MAGGLALCAAMLATPVAAVEDVATDPAAGGRGSFVLPALEADDGLVDWDQVLDRTDDLHWSELLPDPDGLDLVTDQGVTPAGVEWTRTIASHASGVEWTFMTFERADGAAWVESRFVDGDGRAWSRGAPGNDLDGVEWT